MEVSGFYILFDNDLLVLLGGLVWGVVFFFWSWEVVFGFFFSGFFSRFGVVGI